jgi:hypothetical protein
MVTIFWLPIEDLNIIFLSVMSLVWCLWLAVYAVWRGVLSGRTHRLFWLGVLSGFLFFPISMLFILFKAGLHAHGFLDFSASQIVRLGWLTLVWILLGGGVGAFFKKGR